MRYSANIDDQTDLNVWVLWTTQKSGAGASSRHNTQLNNTKSECTDILYTLNLLFIIYLKKKKMPEMTVKCTFNEYMQCMSFHYSQKQCTNNVSVPCHSCV